jgi:putative ABC transport system permease protein
VLGRGAWLATAGAAAGLAGALLVARPLRSLLYGISATDPVTYIAVPLLFIGIALVASYAPARRAMKADPVNALRAN